MLQGLMAAVDLIAAKRSLHALPLPLVCTVLSSLDGSVVIPFESE